MIVSINQPAYLPWLGYFHRIAASDLHIVLDHVQFEKNSFTNRNRIRTPQGWSWLTVPVVTKGRFGELSIDQLEVEERSNWRRKHRDTILQCYAKAPHIEAHRPFVDALYGRPWERLAPLNLEATDYLMRAFGIATPLRRSSEMDPQGTKSELVLELCRKAGATAYLSGALGRDYLDEAAFAAEGIAVHYQDYDHPEYPQCQPGAFEPYMAALDLLLNCGPNSGAILMGGAAGDAERRRA